MLWATFFFGSWFKLRLKENREWSRLKLLRLSAQVVILWIVGPHFAVLGGGLITTENYWLGLFFFAIGFATIIQPAADPRWYDQYLIDPRLPLTRNDKLGFIVVGVMGGIFVVLFSFMGVDWRSQ
ncbi:MAG: hypothetical protein COA62_12560 [Rhodobiaceae bacterium]|nr:MAG: hypothetical protein COA62_12560 [Rhodobiaceae bacterium]